MRALRACLGWFFAIEALLLVKGRASALLDGGLFRHGELSWLAVTRALIEALGLLAGAVLAVAWWKILSRKASAKRWAIAASLVNLLMWTPLIVYGLRAFWHVEMGLWHSSAIGLAGLVIFSLPQRESQSSAESSREAGMPSDGTLPLINSSAGLILFAAAYAAYAWWLDWLRAKGIAADQRAWRENLMLMLMVIALTLVHEFGHASVGLALGMRLRSFVIGPFQWRVRDGRWRYKFEPKAILLGGGSASVVPTIAEYHRWHDIAVAAGGPLANLITGGLALIVAATARADSPVQAGGLLALFGAYSMVVVVSNSIPFRSKSNFSDGAKILHFLRRSPWADLHWSISLAMSTQITPLRPRDYDIWAIRRAEGSFKRGELGLYARLYAFEYFLDCGRMSEAAGALREAEATYCQDVSDNSVELLCALVFGSAYVLRDAAAARRWWVRMEEKKPGSLNASYWRARCALCWIEGRVEEAREVWEIYNSRAENLPEAGAFEFHRSCCTMLREVLGEAAAAA